MSGSLTDIRCFDRGGNQNPDLFPCSYNGSYPQCCEPTQLCASNGLCAHRNQGNDYTPYVIGGCIDSDWSNEGCVSECKDIGYGVGTCSNLGPGYFCCYGTSGCNCTSTDSPGVFRKENVEFVASLSSDGSLPATTSSEASTALTSIQSSITSIADISSTSPAHSAAATQPPEMSSPGSDNTMKLGLGLGLGLGIPLLIFAATLVYLYRRRQSKKNAEQVPMMRKHDVAPSDGPGAYANGIHPDYMNGSSRDGWPQELDASQCARIELDSTTSASEPKLATNHSPLLK